jgi:hypothetical protein
LRFGGVKLIAGEVTVCIDIAVAPDEPVDDPLDRIARKG